MKVWKISRGTISFWDEVEIRDLDSSFCPSKRPLSNPSLKTARDYATESISEKNKWILLARISDHLRIGMWQEIDYKVALFIG